MATENWACPVSKLGHGTGIDWKYEDISMSWIRSIGIKKALTNIVLGIGTPLKIDKTTIDGVFFWPFARLW